MIVLIIIQLFLKMVNYSQTPKKYKLQHPFLMFQMQIDSTRHVIPGLNRGRLWLWDFKLGCIFRWVATCSYNGKQDVGDWNQTGGLHPPNYAMDNSDWFYIKTNLIVQPGQPVDEGFLPIYHNSNTWKTLQGATRSQIMFHEDKGSPGSYGCIVMAKGEWECFKSVFKYCCGHLNEVPYGVIYSW